MAKHMTVYVDDMFLPAKVGRLNSRWCHMMADTPEELHAFAARIGLKRSWAQNEENDRLLHYDLTEGRRHAAVKAGAVEITWREAGRMAMEGRRPRKHAVKRVATLRDKR